MEKKKATELDKILISISDQLAGFIASSKDEFERAPSIRKDPVLKIMALTYDIRDEVYKAYPELRTDGFK